MERGGGRWVRRGPQCWFFTREYTGSFQKIFIPRSSCCGSSLMCSNRLCPVLVPHPPPSVLPEPRHSCVTCLTTESLISEGCYWGQGGGGSPTGSQDSAMWESMLAPERPLACSLQGSEESFSSPPKPSSRHEPSGSGQWGALQGSDLGRQLAERGGTA